MIYYNILYNNSIITNNTSNNKDDLYLKKESYSCNSDILNTIE